MTTGAVTLAGLFGLAIAAPAGDASSSTGPAAAETQPRRAARIDAFVIDDAPERVSLSELQEAIVLRLSDRPVLVAPDRPEPGKLFGYVQIRRASPHSLRLSLILSDGRAYYRDTDIDDQAERTAASVLANLVAGIEDDRLLPDARAVPLPAATKPRPSSVRSSPPKPPALPPRPQLGVFVRPSVIIGVPPPGSLEVAAGGAELGAAIRWPRGPVVGLAVRLAGRSRQGFGLLRPRASVEAGYAWRRAAFELVAVAGFDVEPWVVLEGRRRLALSPTDSRSRTTAVNLGGHVRVAPGYLWSIGSTAGGSLAAVRIAPFIALAGSGSPSPRGVARVFRSEGQPATPLFRIGGLELAGGLEIGLWWTRTNRARR